MKLSKLQTFGFGFGMLVLSPIFVPLVALVAGLAYVGFALACMFTVASVRVGDP